MFQRSNPTSGIRILKDIAFRRVKAYNLVQLFDFVTVTFELYYERRLLAVAHNRMDRYIALRFKGLGASKVNMSHITKSDFEDVYIVKSQSYIQSNKHNHGHYNMYHTLAQQGSHTLCCNKHGQSMCLCLLLGYALTV